MAKTGCPVVTDADPAPWHSRAAGRGASGGQREFTVLARAAVAVGVAAVFTETHQDPDNAPCDGPNMIRLTDMPALIEMLMQLDQLAKANPIRI